MSIGHHPPESDLWVPLPPAGTEWDPQTVHTHYFGLSIPEEQLGVFVYVRWQPAFPLSQGGVCVFRGMDNVTPLEMEYLDYRNTMPWPSVDGGSITVQSGLRLEFTEPGETVRITYESPDGRCSLDVIQHAITPLLARGHVTPGEAERSGAQAGGSEQFMHCTGQLVLDGESHAVDCAAIRDRSWHQIRTEAPGAVAFPPVGWTPMHFGEDLTFNQISFEAPDTGPAWTGWYEVPADAPTHHYAWVIAEGDVREIVRVRRAVSEYHPRLHSAIEQELEAEDETGRVYRFHGRALAAAAIPAWPNCSVRDSVYRWEDERGRVAHCTYQEIFFDGYQRRMNGVAVAGQPAES